MITDTSYGTVIAGLILLCCMSVPASSSAQLDTSIRVLALTTSTGDRAEAAKQMLVLKEAWDLSLIPDGILGPTNVEIINLGIPLPLPDHPGTGNLQSQFNAARDSEFQKLQRDFYGADIVIVFTGNFGTNSDGGFSCGGASAGNWAGDTPAGGTFVPDVDTLDRRHKDTAYIAVVATNGPCTSSFDVAAAHEFGHLFGAGHFDPRPQGGEWLHPDSRAFATVYLTGDLLGGGPVALESIKSVVGDGTPSVCAMWTPMEPECSVWYSQFSNILLTLLGSPTNNNAHAIQTTARSVANYRTGTGPSGQNTECSDSIDNDNDGAVDGNDADCVGPGDTTEAGTMTGPTPPGGTCSTPTAPNNVDGVFLGCIVLSDNALWGHHFVFWQNTSCTSFYETWVAQPIGTGYQFEGFSFTSQGRAAVKGANAELKIKSCNTSSGCSGLSSDSYILTIC